ncbi:hypothetical protein HQ346_23535 [Rhodococcus sp. BP-252]|uniref:hypothetical protein n=1 Tax=unclassified Rhodococcus (in: high G+C Gram-positive bacteria) TaxID=192944 RepID=UPI001C9AC7E6|nr:MULTISPECIES: hypothetical protein [unclassified Rhodococcus (in: high G+C Gram-positive bacteria)]MBY6414577.1 hypothetical protein [Rhodococcus sp. BP-320]MBY6419334.1 hypothetical protein [Rhodococcus sp. BP-321]MBY6424316.1 hypothetical protein [Rhodococcus sp. BP-324]MBY6429413.1 hypothetical protein [Rhodococcus sp. BP-323]MBY6431932.1 hypothetical protein [Rhodococcus sp. BP-322]
MRLTLTSVVAVSALLVLAGCGSDSGGDSGSGANADACTQFEAAYNDIAELSEAGPVGGDVEKWTADKNAAIAKFELLGDQAEGDVQAVIKDVASGMPVDSLELTEADSASGQAFVDNSAAVASACESDGNPITLAEFPLQKFN